MVPGLNLGEQHVLDTFFKISPHFRGGFLLLIIGLRLGLGRGFRLGLDRGCGGPAACLPRQKKRKKQQSKELCAHEGIVRLFVRWDWLFFSNESTKPKSHGLGKSRIDLNKRMR